MARVVDDQATQRLKDLADAEVAAAKERHKTRTSAAGRFAAAEVKLAEAQTVWDAAQWEAVTAKAGAVADLVGSGMKPGAVAELLGVSPKDLRSLRSAGTTTSEANGAADVEATNGSSPPSSTVAAPAASQPTAP